MDISKHQIGSTNYYIKGSKPNLLLLSGVHGDEFEVANSVEKYILKENHSLPDFLYIPHVSPSAVDQKTRLNSFGHDINRSFLNHRPDKEVSQVVEILSQYKFDLCLDFHEDFDLTNEFYMYDTSDFTEDQVSLYQNCIQKTGLRLFNGIDDLDDLTLGFEIKDGYISLPINKEGTDSGFIVGYLVRHEITDRYITFEIPKNLNTDKKHLVVDSLFGFISDSKLV